MKQLALIAEPRHRSTDPDTSRAAAKSIEPHAGYLEQQIVKVAYNGPFIAEQIAQILELREPGRWDEGSIRTAVSRCAKRGLLVADGTGLTRRGREAVAFKAAS